MSIEDEASCDWMRISSAPDRCEFVREYCEGNSLLNFYHIYYCSLHENNYYFLPIAVSGCLVLTEVAAWGLCLFLRVGVYSRCLPVASSRQHCETPETLPIASDIF